MRLSPTAAVFAFACAFGASFSAGAASAASATIDGAAVTGVVVHNDGYARMMSVASALIEPQHLRYAPTEMRPEISNAQRTLVPDGSSATNTDFEGAGVDAVDSIAANNDPSGQVLYVWLWLLPISGVLSLVAYVIVIGQLNRSFAAAAARRGKPYKPLGLFV